MQKPLTPTESTARTRAAVEQLNMTAPIFVGFYQTAKSNIVETFAGPDAYKRACDWADAAAQSTPDRKAVVFGPQSEIFAYAPPRAARLALETGKGAGE